MQISFLNMGEKKYGDCIVVQKGDTRILIDGGHQYDDASIRFQLSQILKQKPPFAFDLIVVTHCHSDHIGSLPGLVKSGDVTAGIALLADEGMGFGIASDQRNAGKNFPSFSDAEKSLFIALQEEDHSDLPDDELGQFLFDGAKLVDQYIEMIGILEEQGTEIIRYGKQDWKWVERLQEQFRNVGLKVLGPSIEHLLLCADGIARASDAAVADSTFVGISDASDPSLPALYRRAVSRFTSDGSLGFAIDMAGTGACKNNQSIVLSFESDGWRALFAGDMQFAAPEVPGLETEMKQLFEKINTNVSYDLIKLTHHTSYNGVNETIFDRWIEAGTVMFVHTGGRRDPKHPDPKRLPMMKKRASKITFLRNDRNGIISVMKENGHLTATFDKGRANDFTPNPVSDEPLKEVEVSEKKEGPLVSSASSTPLQPTVSQKQYGENEGWVEVITKIPHTNTRVTVSIEVEPKKKLIESLVTDPGGNDRFNQLLFITCTSLLARNIGDRDVQLILQQIRSLSGSELLELPPASTPEPLRSIVSNKLRNGSYKGVVIIGGLDVVPSQQLCVIDSELKRRVAEAGFENYDADNFIVWSDDVYGDIDNDMLPELPVSRIPDGKSGALIMQALTAPRYEAKGRFGVRNLARPFADSCYQFVPGGALEVMEISETFGPSHPLPEAINGSVYLMLHGSESDSTRFWGERPGGRLYEAIRISSIPHNKPGSIVFTGCCWGALSAEQTAYRKALSEQVFGKTPDNSIALAYLKGGALAFIGCTGSHYSPTREPYHSFGKPMHDAFWKNVSMGKAPAKALYEAKMEYVKELPHGQTDPFSQAVELKILRQYTCLGLGW